MPESESPRVSRRALLGWIAAGAAAPALGWLGWRAVGPEPDRLDPVALMPASPAERLASCFGVVTHLNFLTSVYAQSDRVLEQISDLGVRNVRNRLAVLPAVRSPFLRLSAAGVKIEGVCGALGDPQPMGEVMAEVVRSYPRPEEVFSAFEGINEPNNSGVPWIAETRAKTRSLFEERNAHGLDAIPIVGPSLARVTSGGVEGFDTREQSARLGDLTPWIDIGNIHVYPRGLSPSTDLDDFISWQRQVCGDDPIYNTEGGFFTATNYRGGSNPSSEDSARQYAPRQVMENWIRGIRRFFLYELLDDPDATDAQREAHFGMIQVSGPGPAGAWTPKPHYLAMKNFLAVLGDPGPPHPVQGLTCGVANGGTQLRKALVQKRDGSHYLCLWRDVDVYEPSTGQAVQVSPQNVVVTLPTPADVTEYRPSTRATPVASHRGVTAFTVPIEGELHICRIVTHPRRA